MNSESRPVITLNNGVELPALGFGVFQTPRDVTTHLAIWEAPRDGSPETESGDLVTDEEYAAGARSASR
ncbi:MAG: hypothetical protein ACJ77O_04260 [Chloroflexota bacterium]